MTKLLLRAFMCSILSTLPIHILADNQAPLLRPSYAKATEGTQGSEGLAPFVLPTLTIKLDSSSPIKFQPDLSSVGKELGAGIGDLISTGAHAFADTASGNEYGADMSRGMSGLARNLGGATRSFNTEANQTLFPELSTTFRGFVGSAINKRNVFQFGGLVALSLAITATGYYLTKFLWEFISYKVFNPKPVILLPETTYGRIDRLKRWWNGYTSPPMVFDAAVKERLMEIEDKTKSIRTHNKNRKNKHNTMSYDNLLLHGKPGTGKTLFARTLADHTNMDFVATTAASLLQSGVAGVKYFNDIMKMARRSSYGMILFIDEADALFVDRDTLNPDSDHYKVLSHILALTGDGNSTFMLIAATNHAYVMDDAMERRFQDRVLMPLPDNNTRAELIDLYAQKLLFNAHTNGKTFVRTAKNLLNDTTIESLVEQTAGLSHAEIKDLINAIHKKAYAGEQKMITQKHITDAVRQAIEKHTSLIEDQEKKQRRFNYA